MDIESIIEKTDNVLFSGGANGSDLYWANAFDIMIVNYSFPGHYIKKTNFVNIELTDIQLEKYRSEVEDVCKIIKRPPLKVLKPYVRNLLLRNAWQAFSGESLYAIGEFNEKGPSLGISGGTAYACEIFCRRFTNVGNIPLYFYDQSKNKWFQGYRDENGRYILKSLDRRPPAPKGHFTAIGTRELTDSGKNEIDILSKI